MKKKAELLQKIEAMRKSVIDLVQAGNIAEAKTKSEELSKMVNEFNGMKEEKPMGGNVKMNKEERLNQIKKAVNSFIHRGWKGMDDESRAVLKPVNATEGTGQVESVNNRGGVLVPYEVADFVLKDDIGVYRLRDLVFDYFPNTKSGHIPKLPSPSTGLVAMFDEMPTAGISKTDVKFGSVEFSVNDYGVIVPVSNDLVADANADVFGIISEYFAVAQRNTENALILDAINSMIASATEITDWKGIAKALNKTTPIGSKNKVILTNSDGYNWLDTLTDDNGRPILTQALIDDPQRMFRGFRVIQLPDAQLPTATPEADHDYGAIPFIVGDLRQAVCFIERRGLEIAYNPYSDSAYAKNSTDVRVTCRLDCEGMFENAVQKLTYTPANDD